MLRWATHQSRQTQPGLPDYPPNQAGCKSNKINTLHFFGVFFRPITSV